MEVTQGRVDLYHRIFPLQVPNLAFVGLVTVAGAHPPVAEMQARWVARVFSGAAALPGAAEMTATIERQRAMPPADALRCTALQPRHCRFGAALALIRAGRRSDVLPAVLEQLGEAWERVGETAAAIAVWSEALAEHERLRNAPALARLRRRLALAEWDRGHFASAQTHLEAGFQALAGSEPSPEQADLLHIRKIFLHRLGDDHSVRAVAQELATLAEQLGSPKILAQAALTQIGLCLDRLDFVGARAASLHSLSLAEAAREPLLVQRAHDLLAFLAYTLGDHALARHHAELSLALARRLGAPTLEVYPRTVWSWWT